MIKGPKNAIPTLKGWVSPKGELLKSQRITQAQIDEWYGATAQAPKPEPIVQQPEPTPVYPASEPTVEELVIEETPVTKTKPKRATRKTKKASSAKTSFWNKTFN